MYIQGKPMKTVSERVFETFLKDNKLRFQKVKEQETPRPDYLVDVGHLKLFFEVKELAADENFKIGSLQVSGRIVGNHIRQRIRHARKQVKFGAAQGMPSVLLVYNNLDPMHLFGTEETDFFAAMYGEPTLVLDRDSGEITDSFYGRNQLLREDWNIQFSAVGRLCPASSGWEVTLFENVFAKVKIPIDLLPPCFGVRRVEITSAAPASGVI